MSTEEECRARLRQAERRIAVVRVHVEQEIDRITKAADAAHRTGSVIDETADRDAVEALKGVLAVIDGKET